MPSLKVQLSEHAARRFREAAMRRFGFGKGALSLAAERALSEWAAREQPLERELVEMVDPVKTIEGLLAHVKVSSVSLQHEASRIRARKALTHAARRR